MGAGPYNAEQIYVTQGDARLQMDHFEKLVVCRGLWSCIPEAFLTT